MYAAIGQRSVCYALLLHHLCIMLAGHSVCVYMNIYRYMNMRVLGFAHWTMETGWQPTNRLIVTSICLRDSLFYEFIPSCMIDRLPVSSRTCAAQHSKLPECMVTAKTIERSQNTGKYQGNPLCFFSQRQILKHRSINLRLYDFSCRQFP